MKYLLLSWVALLPSQSMKSSASVPFSMSKSYNLAALTMPSTESFILEYHFANRERFDLVFKEIQPADKEGLGWSVSISNAGKVRQPAEMGHIKSQDSRQATKPRQQAVAAGISYLEERGLLSLPSIVRITTKKSGSSVVNFERLPSVPGGWLECEVSASGQVIHLRRGQ